MFKDFIKQSHDLQVYPIISLLVFVVYFLALSAKALLYKKAEIAEMAALPLDTVPDEPITSPNI